MKKIEDSPKLTIVTPTFNLIKNGRENLFRNIVDIIQKQTYSNIEHLIIDGGSTDGTCKLLKKYADKGLIKFYSEVDHGVYDAFNKGLQKASGTYIAYMGSDDTYYHQDSVKLLMDAIIENNTDWAYGDTLYQTENGNLWFWKGTLKSLPFGSGPCHQSMIVSVEKMKEIGGFELNNAVADIDVMLKLVKHNYTSTYVNSIISIFRAGGWSTKEGRDSLKRSFLKSFYNLFGKTLNLSKNECELLYAGECFSKLSPKENIELGLKLSYPEWVKTFFSKDWCILKDPNTEAISSFPLPNQKTEKRFYLLGIPLIKTRNGIRNFSFYFLGVKIFNIKKKMSKSKYALLGVSILKTKEKRKY